VEGHLSQQMRSAAGQRRLERIGNALMQLRAPPLVIAL